MAATIDRNVTFIEQALREYLRSAYSGIASGLTIA
jgi:hypothetical protein